MQVVWWNLTIYSVLYMSHRYVATGSNNPCFLIFLDTISNPDIWEAEIWKYFCIMAIKQLFWSQNESSVCRLINPRTRLTIAAVTVTEHPFKINYLLVYVFIFLGYYSDCHPLLVFCNLYNYVYFRPYTNAQIQFTVLYIALNSRTFP